MSQYYISSSNLTFSLYENKIVYSRENDSVKKECTEYWFNNQNEIHSLEEMSEISYIVSGSNSYIKDNGWSNISNIAFTESDVVNSYDGAKTISDIVNNVMSVNSINESLAIDLIKDTNPVVKNWSI